MNELERSPVHGNSCWYNEPETLTTAKEAVNKDNKEHQDASSNEVVNSNGHYSLQKPIDDIYKVPTSNLPLNNLYPENRILFKVVATHAYVGDDTDELSFEPGEVIAVVPFDDSDDQDEGWLTGVKELTKEKGVFPENFTKRLEN